MGLETPCLPVASKIVFPLSGQATPFARGHCASAFPQSQSDLMRVGVRLQPTEPEKAGIGVAPRSLTSNGQFLFLSGHRSKKFSRRSATLTPAWSKPWAEAHGYHHAVAPRRWRKRSPYLPFQNACKVQGGLTDLQNDQSCATATARRFRYSLREIAFAQSGCVAAVTIWMSNSENRRARRCSTRCQRATLEALSAV